MQVSHRKEEGKIPWGDTGMAEDKSPDDSLAAGGTSPSSHPPLSSYLTTAYLLNLCLTYLTHKQQIQLPNHHLNPSHFHWVLHPNWSLSLWTLWTLWF